MNIYEGPNEVADADATRAVLERRGIEDLVHFTRMRNIPSILKNGIRPQVNPKTGKRYELDVLDVDRFDGRLHHVSLTITMPNKPLFYRHRCNSEGLWAVVVIDPLILTEVPALFFPYNAATKTYRGINIDDPMWCSADALERMFVSENGRSKSNPQYVWKDQAEIQVLGPVQPQWIRVVATGNDVPVAEKVKLASIPRTYPDVRVETRQKYY
jgi:hypothetical protein